jgi:hypothetical protein
MASGAEGCGFEPRRMHIRVGGLQFTVRRSQLWPGGQLGLLVSKPFACRAFASSIGYRLFACALLDSRTSNAKDPTKVQRLSRIQIALFVQDALTQNAGMGWGRQGPTI